MQGVIFKEEPYVLIEGGSGFRRALKKAPDHWRFYFPPCLLCVYMSEFKNARFDEF